jgi:multisubunit Na+/H+ antiporter MnhB subunit
MGIEVFLDAGLALLALALASWVIASRGAFTAAVGFVAFGLALSLVWVRLAAIDVALTEAAIGGGVTGVLLLLAARRLQPGEARSTPPRAATRLLAALLCTAIAAGLAAVVLALPTPPPSLAPQAVAELPALAVGNAVTAVLLAYRSFDTLLEKVVLLVALIGIWSLAPDRFWGGAPAPLQAAHPDGPLVFLARVLPPIGFVVGIYEFWVGANAPGGAFQGGTILAAMWVLAMLAGLLQPPAIAGRALRLALVAGPAVFLAAGIAGFITPGIFLGYPTGLAKPLMIAIEVPMTLSIAMMLGMMMAGPPTRPPRQ